MNQHLRFESLLAQFGNTEFANRRPISTFTINPVTQSYHRQSREAYARRSIHCRILSVVDQGKPCVDPVRGATPGSARRTLMLYMYACLPEFPGKAKDLEELRRLNNANFLIQGIERMILDRLASGDLSDAEYATRVLDDTRFFSFAKAWLSRKKGSRAMGASTASPD